MKCMETCLTDIVHIEKDITIMMLTWIYNEAINDQQIKVILLKWTIRL